MRLERFTLRGQEAVQSAVEIAERNQHQSVEPEHLLLAMLEQSEGIVRPLLEWQTRFTPAAGAGSEDVAVTEEASA